MNAVTQTSFVYSPMPSPMRLKRVVVHWTLFLMTVSISATAIAQCQISKNQTDLNECMAAELAREDEKLNGAFREYTLSLSADQVRRFEESHRAWRRFMELSCDFESSGVTGGSLQPAILANCRTRLTRERLGDIDFLRSCASGSHNCPPN